MDKKIDKLIELCGTKNKYQFILLVISLMAWINNMMVSVTLPILEQTPDVIYKNKYGQLVNGKLDYEICELSYKITKKIPYSWVSDFNISCDKLKVGFIGTINFLGSFLGSITFNLVVDNFGRKNTVIFSLIFYLLINTTILFFNDYYIVLFLNFFLELCGCYPNYSLLLMTEEITHLDYRGYFGTIINAGYSACALVYFPLYFYLNSWKKVFVVNSVIAFFILMSFILYGRESPRFLISKGEINSAINILEDIAKFHNIEKEFKEKIQSEEYKSIIIELNEISMRKNEQKYILENLEEPLLQNENNNKKFRNNEDYNWFTLIKYPSIRYKFLILCFLGFCISGSYNGVSISIKNLPGNVFFTGVIFYFFEVVICVVCGYIINIPNFGRKGTILTFYLICFFSFITFLLFNVTDFGKISIVFVCKLTISGIFDILYTYFLENYPTSIRAIGFGINTSFDNIGGAVFPIIIEILNEKELFSLLAFLNAIQFFLMLFMPETCGVELPETILEVEEEKKNRKKSFLSNSNYNKDFESFGITDYKTMDE